VSSRYLPRRGLSDSLITTSVELCCRYLPRRGLSDSLITTSVELCCRYLPRRGLSDGLMTAIVAAIGEELAGELVGLLVHAVHTQTNLNGPHSLFVLTNVADRVEWFIQDPII
jgi:hypothetical protein